MRISEKINATARELCDRTVPCEVCIFNEKGYYCTSRDCAKKIIKLGYRKVGKDEQVVKKDQLIEMLNSNLESGKRMGYAQGREETAREIIAIIIDDDGADLNKIAQKYGIELE